MSWLYYEYRYRWGEEYRMKNAINYFYNLYPDDIRQSGKQYYFDVSNTDISPTMELYGGAVTGTAINNNVAGATGKTHYVLMLYNGSRTSAVGDYNGANVDGVLLKDIYNVHLSLLKRNIYVHQIILNKDGQIITLIGGVPYVLMKMQHYKEKVTFDNVWSFTTIGLDGLDGSRIERLDWGTLWANKNDHLEYQISQLGQKHPLLRDSLSYFIGLAETSIQLVNSVTLSKENITKVIAHDRITPDDTAFELYNPFNLIVDNRARDMAEYFKNGFFRGKDISKELNTYMMYSGLSNNESVLFLARMIYPTYYFDLYEDIISGRRVNVDVDIDGQLKKVIIKTNDYERLIKSIYSYFKKFLQMAPIDWLER